LSFDKKNDKCGSIGDHLTGLFVPICSARRECGTPSRMFHSEESEKERGSDYEGGDILWVP